MGLTGKHKLDPFFIFEIIINTLHRSTLSLSSSVFRRQGSELLGTTVICSIAWDT